MTHLAHSHPERETTVRQSGVEFLAETRQRIAAKPDDLTEPDVRCPRCGAALTARWGRNKEQWGIYHPAHGDCALKGMAWKYKVATVGDAVKVWKDSNP